MDDAAPRPKKRPPGTLPMWVVVGVLLVVIGGLVGGWFYVNQPIDGVRVEDVRNEVGQKLPPGTPKDEILKWFESKGYTSVGDMRNPGGKVIGYRALVRNDTRMEKGEIEITCKFGADDKVTSVDVNRIKVRQ